MRLTAESAGGLKPRRGKRAETFFDRTKGAPPSFALRVTETGARTYYLIYRAPGSDKKQFLRIGDATRMSLADARDRARDADFSLHDLRATCATGVRRMSGLPHVPALVLGHQGVPGVPDITSRYDRADTVPEVAAGLNAWALHVEGLIGEKPPALVAFGRTRRDGRKPPRGRSLTS